MEVKPGQDGGWGWMVVAGGFLTQVMFGWMGRSMGVIYLLVLERFQGSATFTAWTTALPMLLWGILGPVASMLIKRWSCRTVTGIGATLCVLGTLCAVFAPNLLALSFTYSILTGVGMAFTYVPCFVLTGEYFVAKRGVAMATMGTGSSVGAMTGPPLLWLLFSIFGFQGLMLMYTGLLTHFFIGVCLFRPFSVHTRMVQASKLQREEAVEENLTCADHSPNQNCSSAVYEKAKNEEHTTNEKNSTEPNTVDSNHCNKLLEGEIPQIKIVAKDLVNVERTTGSLPNLHKYSHQIVNHLSDHKLEGSLPHVASGDRYDLLPSLNQCSQSIVSVVTVGEEEGGTVIEDTNTHKRTEERMKCCGVKFNFSLMKEPAFILILFVTFSAINAFAINIVFLAAMAIQKGMETFEAMLLLSIMGLADCIFKIPFGLLMDWKVIRPHRVTVYIFTLMISGTAIALLPLSNNFYVLAVILTFRGACSGAFMSQRATILAVLIGDDRVAAAFGIQLLTTGLGTLVGRIMGGVLKDTIGSYDIAFYVSGTGVVFSSLLFYVYWFWFRQKLAEKRKN